jgi:hypothetical protein
MMFVHMRSRPLPGWQRDHPEPERFSQDECFVRSVNPIMSPFGTSQKCHRNFTMAAFGAEADMD